MAMRETALPSSKEEIRTLTSLRAMAALFVLMLHYNQAFPGYNFIEIMPFISYGHVGVDVFFFLSGYILAYVYSDELKSFSWKGARRFLVLRFARIYPAHIAALFVIISLYILASVAFSYQFNDPDNWRPIHLVYHVTMTHAWGASDLALWNAPSWSISSEWLAYLLFPLTLPIILRLRPTGWIVGCAVLLLSIAGVYGVAGIDLASSYRGWPVVFRVLSEFWTGTMLFLLAGHIRRRPAFDVVAASVIALYLAAAALAIPDYVLVMAAPLLIIALHRCSGFVWRLLITRSFVFLGVISYSIYIIHFPLQLVLTFIYGRLNIGDMGLALNAAWYLVAMAAAILAGWILYATVENPARRAIKRRWGERHEPLSSMGRDMAKAPR